MKKILLAVLIVGLTTGAILLFNSDSARKQATIGIINPHSAPDALTQGFIEGLADYGYIEGKNVSYIKSENDKNGIDAALSQMMQKKVDMIFTVTTPVTKKAKAATHGTIPVIFAMYDPVKSRLINSLSQPGGNLTGVQLRGSMPKAFDWLLTVAPKTKHLFVPVKYDTKAAKQSLIDLQEAAAKVGVRVTVSQLATRDALSSALASLPEDIDAIFIIHSIFIHSQLDIIVDTAVARKILIASGSALHQKGATISYGLNRYNTGKQVSRIAHDVLQGASPDKTPTEISNYTLGINLKTAEASHVSIADDILRQADDIVR